MNTEIDLRQAVCALSDALDLVGVDDIQHGTRVAFMAQECARRLGWSTDDRELTLHAGLLHDCGVSSTEVHRKLVNELDWSGSQEHCRLGERLLHDFAPLAELAPIIHYHHTHWDELMANQVDERTARMANLIYLVDRADALSAPHYGGDLMLVRDEIRDQLARLAGSFFSPDLTAAYLDVSATEAFWYSLEPRHQEQFLWQVEREHRPVNVGTHELRQFAAIFARIVDAKSRFTWEHSEGVARLARRLGEWSGLPPSTCEKLEIAGLLHDLGKLQVPDAVLDKPGALDPAERSTINRHAFETYQILSRIRGLEDVALWAAYHHETLDGSGYPFHLHGSQIPREARIVAVADIFQAFTQTRPYRNAISSAETLRHLQELAGQHHLDGDIVALVAAHLDECSALATGDDVS